MLKHNIKRIIYTASAGIDNEIPGPHGKMIMDRLKNPLTDHRNAIEYIKSHQLIYTIVRPMGLTNEPLTGKYKETKEGIPENSHTIPRADVAHFIVKALTDKQYDNTSVAIAT